MEISTAIAERAGRLRGKYPSIKTMDAIQISAALEIKSDAIRTNDKKLKQIDEIEIVMLSDYS